MQPLLEWKINKYYLFWVCVFSLRHAVCNAHASYCPLWPVRLYNIFPLYLINDTIFEQKLLNRKYVLWFSLQLFSEIFLILRRNEREMIKNVYWSSYTVPVCYSWHIFVKFDISTDSRKIHKYKNSWKFVRWEPSCSLQTDRHDADNSRSLKFCEHA